MYRGPFFLRKRYTAPFLQKHKVVASDKPSSPDKLLEGVDTSDSVTRDVDGETDVQQTRH